MRPCPSAFSGASRVIRAAIDWAPPARQPTARMTHRYLAHTADLRASLSGADLASTYQAAADLVREILVGASAVAAEQELRLDVEGSDDAERFFRFVRELLYLYDCEGFLPARAAVGAPAGGRAKA